MSNEWISGPKEYFLNARIFYENEKEWNWNEPIKLGKGEVQTISNIILKEKVSKIETRVIEIEPVKLKLNLEEGDYTINQLNLGIRDSNEINSIGQKYSSKQGWEDFQAFFFDFNHAPSGFQSKGFVVGSKWPTLKTPFITEDLRFYFDRLKEFKPEISSNLEKCICLLEQHYKQPIKVN